MTKKIKVTEEAEETEEESLSKKEFKVLIEAYKLQNPEKYAVKEAELKKKLASL